MDLQSLVNKLPYFTLHYVKQFINVKEISALVRVSNIQKKLQRLQQRTFEEWIQQLTTFPQDIQFIKVCKQVVKLKVDKLIHIKKDQFVDFVSSKYEEVGKSMIRKIYYSMLPTILREGEYCIDLLGKRYMSVWTISIHKEDTYQGCVQYTLKWCHR